MHRLIYLSSASSTFLEKDLHDILTKSRRNNVLSDITGLLLYYDGAIFQVLEGGKLEIYSLYYKIMKDPRHNGIVKLFDEEIVTRDFSDWSMGFKNLSVDEWDQLSGYINFKNKKEFLKEIEPKSVQILTMVRTFLTVNIR